MSNREQVSPDELATENELICTKLLGWGKCEHIAHIPGLFHTPAGKHEEVPSFTTWAEAGLILDAFKARDCLVSIQFTGQGGFCAVNDVSAAQKAKSLPSTIRAAALEYIRSLP